MTAKTIIEQIAALPPDEQAEVVRFAYRLDAERQLSGAELSALAKRMIASADLDEIDRLRHEIQRAFYGSKSDA